MAFLIRTLFLGAVVSLLGTAGVYYFFKDSGFLGDDLFGKGMPVVAHHSVEKNAAAAVYTAYKHIHNVYTLDKLTEIYNKAVLAKYDAIAEKKDKLSLQHYLALEKKGLVKDWLNKNDKNADGQVSKEEWPGDIWRFSRLNQNRDDFVSANEYWLSFQQKRIDWFSAADKNQDGSITKEEFAGYYSERKAGKKFSQSADLNNNKFLDEIEANELAHQYRLK